MWIDGLGGRLSMDRGGPFEGDAQTKEGDLFESVPGNGKEGDGDVGNRGRDRPLKSKKS